MSEQQAKTAGFEKIFFIECLGDAKLAKFHHIKLRLQQ
jgi:hypothetical protein